MEKFFNALGSGVRNYFDFSGLATRYEFWAWMATNSVIAFLLFLIFIETEATKSLESTFGENTLGWHLAQFYIALITIPTWALITRRMRAIGRNPVWVLVWALSTPILVILSQLIFGNPESYLSKYPAGYIYFLNDPLLIFLNFFSSFLFLITVLTEPSADDIANYIWNASSTVWCSRLIFWVLTHKEASPSEKEFKFTTPQQPARVNPIPLWLGYVGVGVAGYFIVGIGLFLFVGSSVPGLVGLSAIAGAAFFIWIYRNSRKESQPSVKPTPSQPPIQPNIESSEPVPVIASDHMNCLECGAENPPEATYCIECGGKLPNIVCPKCKTENLPEAKFCMSCGEKR